MPVSLTNDAGLFELSSLRGGLDDTTPVISMAQDTCTTAEDVEFVTSMLGERRKGCTAISLGATFSDPTLDAITWQYRHLPMNSEGGAELWALGQSLTTSTYVIAKRDIAGWTVISPDDAFDVTNNQGHKLSAQTLHGKLFIAGKTAQDRLHVYDGSFLRRVGLAQPAAPVVTNTGVGAFATTRYYRVRYVLVSGGITQALGEPSLATTFTPSGSGLSARITKPASIGERETHWEVEGSLDNANFYTLARIVVGTTTYDDSTPAAGGYASLFELAADVGVCSLLPSAKFLTADQDRLLLAGSWENSSFASRVMWTPVYADPNGGSDERMDLSTDPFLDLDGFEGGEITGMSRAVNGYIFVFKRNHIYQLTRTNSRSASYEATCLTKARGALPGSLVEAINQTGQPSLYFLDPSVGPVRMSANGLQWCGRDLQTLWRRVNVDAFIPCHGVYYHKNRQLHYWLALDGADYPNFKIVLHVNEMRDTDEGGRRGWVTVSKNSRIAVAHCSVMFSDNIDNTGTNRSFTLVPFIGKERWVVSGSPITNYIQLCDVGGTDAFTAGDTAASYRGTLVSKPFVFGGLLNQYAILTGALLLKSSSTPTGLVFVKAIRDFGEEIKMVNTGFYTTGTETHLVQQLEDFGLSEFYAIQLALGDLDDTVTPPDTWGLELLQLKISSGNTA